MAYTMKKYVLPYSNEYEYTYKGNYGAKGEKRAPRKKKTTKEIEYQNRWNKRKLIRRLIKLNFEDDLYVTLTYKKEHRKDMEGVKKDFKKYRDRLRRAYKKHGEKLKYIYCIEIGSRGAVHIHMVVNRIRGADTDKLLSRQWYYGHIYLQTLYPEGDYEQLACYLAKVPQEEAGEEKRNRMERMEDITEDNYDYNTSKNLVRPEPEIKEYKNWTMRRILKEGPRPTPGYYIDKSTIRVGVNQYTGMSYLYYTEQMLRRKRRE